MSPMNRRSIPANCWLRGNLDVLPIQPALGPVSPAAMVASPRESSPAAQCLYRVRDGWIVDMTELPSSGRTANAVVSPIPLVTRRFGRHLVDHPSWLRGIPTQGIAERSQLYYPVTLVVLAAWDTLRRPFIAVRPSRD